MDDASLHLEPAVEIVLEGQFLKLSRNKIWQDRYFVFTSDGLLSYYHKKGETVARASYQVTRQSGCEVSDLYVEQRPNGTKMESLYCITFTWPEEATTIGSYPTRFFHESFKDDASFALGSTAPLIDAPASPVRDKKQNAFHALKSPFKKQSKSFKGRIRSMSPARSADGSMQSQDNNRHTSNWFKKEASGFTDQSTSSLGSDKPRRRYSKHRGHASMPAIVGMEIEPDTFQEYETILEGEGDKGECRVEVSEAENRRSADVRAQQGPKVSKNVNGGSVGSSVGEKPTKQKETSLGTYQVQHAAEQEKLHSAYYGEQKAKMRESRQQLVQATKVGIAASAAVGVGVLTAGVGLAAGLVVLGAAAAAGGTAGVAEAGLKKWQKSGKLTIATTSYENAKRWKSSVYACLDSDTAVQSTWGQMFVAEGRKKTSILVPHDVELMNVRSRGLSADDDSAFDDLQNKSLDLPSGQSALFLRDRNFLVEEGARWRPLEGGWSSFLGPGAPSLRIFAEERVRLQPESKKVARLAVGENTCTPLKTQLVLKANPLDAFMCHMSYARISSTDAVNDLVPNSGQSASFRLLEKIDDHTDIIHLICRKLYLFPSWTEARDFVLFRYWRYESDGSYFVCYESVEHRSCPPLPGYVRGDLHQVCTFAPTKNFDKKRKIPLSGVPECLVTSVVQVDPKGWVPTKPIPFLSNQTYADAFGIASLLQILDIRDAIERDRFLDVGQELQLDQPPVPKDTRGSKDVRQRKTTVGESYDLRFANRERCDSLTFDTLSGLETHPPPLEYDTWAEPDANSFLVRGPNYKKDKIKINAGASVGKLVAVDLVLVDEPIYKGMAMHPTERIQRALHREKKLKELGKESDMPPFVFVVNIVLPGPPFYHLVFYYAVDDMKTIDGSDGTPCSKLCKKFLFGESDDFRDKTFKLIPQIVEGNFMVRKAVGSTPAIMGKKLRQLYSRTDRFLEVILDCGSSQVATGVIKLSLGYARTLMVDMGFVLEGDEEMYLPERIFGCARLKYPDFTRKMRKVEPY